MIHPKEDKKCYATREQREILLKLIENEILTQDFFLTGGTALSVFYLHHRESNDLDLFTTQAMDLNKVDFELKSQWKNEYVKIKDSSTFLSALLEDVKVDFVIDPLSNPDNRPPYNLESDKVLMLDTVSNILSNKLTALASRTEPKDFVDFYYLWQALKVSSLEVIYREASKKDAIFDDPPTSAYQIEQGLDFFIHNHAARPTLKLKFEEEEFILFYQKLISQIFDMSSPR